MNTKLKRVILHWTAGTHYPCATDKEHYHYLLDVKGTVYHGKYPPEANIECNGSDYAAHTGGRNTGSIGVAMCGMADFSYPRLSTPFPISRIQAETAFFLVAKLCDKYSIPVLKDTVFTHYEFGLENPATSSGGKIDIIYLPPFEAVHKYQVGNFIRNKVLWYLQKIKEPKNANIPDSTTR